MSEMDDLTVTRLCLKAAGLEQDHTTMLPAYFDAGLGEWGRVVEYDPLTDDAQCFGLVKKMGLSTHQYMDRDGKQWEAAFPFSKQTNYVGYHQNSADLNRAVCLCVAHMQQAKGERDAG